MTTKSNSLQSYPDARKLWDDVYEKFSNDPSAEFFVIRPRKPLKESERTRIILRLNRFRKLLQTQLYPKDHPNYGTSLFDPFILSKGKDKRGNLIIKVYKSSAENFEVIAGDTEIIVDTSSPLTDSSASEQGE